MRFYALIVLLCLAGCDLEITTQGSQSCPQDRPCPYKTVAPVDLPMEFRQPNYGGSCMHASLIPLLRWQNRGKDARWWRQNHGGAAGVPDLADIAERRGLRYAYTGTFGFQSKRFLVIGGLTVGMR